MTRSVWEASVLLFIVMVVGGASFFVIPPMAKQGEKEKEKFLAASSLSPPSLESISFLDVPSFRTPGIFPCSDCHDPEEDNPKPRVLKEEHQEIQLKHGQNMWCFHCHSFQDRDKLKLASGEKIEFEKQELLCAQCHGKQFQDWLWGVHGKRRGRWASPKVYYRCQYCHDPHQPQFPRITAKSPPPRPEEIRWRKDDKGK